MWTDLDAASSARLIATLGAGLIATFIAVGFSGSVTPATAQEGYDNVYFGYQSQQRYKRRAVPRAPSSIDQAADNTADKKGKTEEAKKSAPQDAVYAIVSLADQHVTIYDSTGRIAQSPISTGKPGHPTPIGLFSILGKERWHHSNIYSGAPMPFMQRITWSGVAMHLGVVPGYPASHGCIRLPDGFAQQLWGTTQIGSRVVVARRDTIPVEISNTLLPVPRLRPAPEVLPGGQQSSLPSSAPVKLASNSLGSPMSAAAAEETQPSPANAPKLLNPIEYAMALKEFALASKAAADQAAKDSLPVARAAGAEARRAMADVNKAEADLRAAKTKLAAHAPAPTATAAEAASATASDAAQEDIDRARAALAAAQSREAAERQAAFIALQTWKDAVAAGELAANTLKEAGRRLKPVSVLFSKKEGRVFIRQDWKEVYDAPITFKDPSRPIGTHLFIAVNGDAGGKLKWSAISVPSGAPPSDDPRRKRSKNAMSADTASTLPPQGDTASAALD
jgi:lipoprotein-anchoring transpeptidase ErfK/SrfK